MAIPLNLYDQMVYDAGYKFIPQSQYLLEPFQIPTIPGTTNPVQQPIPKSSGILSLQPQGGGGALQARDINYDDFAGLGFDAYSRRQPTPLVDETNFEKINKSFFGFPSYREQELTGPDMGEYIASNTDIPLELTKAGQLQSGLSSIGKGITGLLSKAGGIGPISALLGSMDKFDTLPALDQQFIEQSMGYRGPTIFGENTGGNYVDPFGVNVRSAFGNYAEKVRDDFSDLTESLTGRLSDKYGATFDEELGEFVGKGAKKANDMTKMMRSKFIFRNKQIKQQKFDAKIAEQVRQNKIDEINKQKIAAKKAGDAKKARDLQIAAAAKAQEISRKEAERQQAAIERERGTGDSAPGGDRGDYGNPGGSSGEMNDSNAGTYCFDPSTPIQMADGSTKEIKNIQLGDDTKGGEVTGVFQFKVNVDEIHDYKGVIVAGSHYVKEDGRFIMVKDSPLAVKIDKIPVVYSLDTTGRRIFINDIEFADYNGDGVAKNFLTNAGVDLSGFNKEVLRQVENKLI